MRLYLVHHGDAVDPGVDTQRPLSAVGREQATRVAAEAAARGAKPAIVWHSGKLRARQTADAFWKSCNALAELHATKDLQPSDQPAWFRDRLRGETRDIAIVGHFPHLPRLLALLVHGHDDAAVEFPPHGLVALRSTDGGNTWSEEWRVAP